MANINVSVAASNVSVTETVSNIIITDAANVIIGNITTTQSNISVTSTPSVINVGTGPIPTPVTNAEIRAALTATSPILYDQSNGVFSLDSNASFIGKTTDNLAEGTTNLYFTAARARGNVSATTATGITYDSANGVFSLASIPNSSLTNSAITINGTAVSLGGTRTLTTADINESGNLYFTTARARQSISGSGDISYDANTGVISYTGTPGDITDVIAGNGLTGGGSSGNVTLNVGGGTGITVNADNIAVNMSAFSTTDLAEGANLYYTSTRANTAIDTRVNKAFVEGLGVSYTSLTDKPTIPTHTSNLVNDSGFITSATANVVSVNGETGVVVLDTGDIAEGANLYYTTTRANSAIDARVNKAFVEALAISYTSLANTPTNVSFFTNDAGYLVAANLTSLTANVNSVNGQTGVVSLTTTNIPEGSNLYYTTDRANTAIGAYQGNINTPGTVTAGVANATTVNATTVNASNVTATSNITATGNITAGNVITASIHSNGSSNITLNSNTALVIKETIKGISTNVGNINGDGYGFFLGAGLTGQTLVNNASAGNLDSYFFTTGNATANSNIITGASIALISAGAPNVSANLNLVTPYYTVGPFGSAVQDPFPVGTYVTSVDAANSTITLNNPAAVSRDLSVSFTGGGATFNRTALLPGAFDTGTGLLAGLISQFTAGAGASRSAIVGQSIFTQGAYGYPVTGPTPANFVYAIGSSSNYSQGNLPSNRFMARTKIEAPTTVFQAPRGMVVGNGDLTSRAENDGTPSFGVNVLWDGLTTNTDYGGGNPFTQLLMKQYSDNSFASSSPVNGGPRILFTASRGNKNQNYLATYPRNNDELGRLTWWGPTQYLPGTSTVNPPAWISGVAGQDFVDTNSGMGMYFANSPNTTTFDRSLYLSSSKGATLIASSQDSTAAQQPVIFAPSHLVPTGANNGNSVFLYNQTVSGTETAIDSFAPSGAHFAQINYANASALTGSRITVTNGNNFATQHEGNIVLSLDRNSNTANVRVAARSGVINYLGSSNPDRVRFDFAPESLANAAPVTISGFTNAIVAGALNGNVFYVKGPFINGSFREYELYTDSGLTTGVNLGVTNVNAGPGTFTYTRTNSVTAKEWTMVLAQGSNDLVLAEDGVTRTTFASGGNVNVTGNINLTGRLLGYNKVYGEFYHSANITPAAADTIYTFPLDTTVISSDVLVNNTSRINIVKSGIYKIFMSTQVLNDAVSNDYVMRFWLRKNGADVPGSATYITPLKLQEQIVTMHWMVESDGDDYWEIAYYVNNTNVRFPFYPAITSPVTAPAAPPIIVNVLPVGA